jgi:hypothetical protein
LTGAVTSVGNATSLGSFTSAQLITALTDETGSGSAVFSTSPTLVTPALGTPQSGNFSTGTFTWPTFNQNTTGTASNVTGTVAILNGGTGQTTANAAFNALAPSQTGNSGKYLTTDGSNTSWATNPLGTVTSVAATVPSFLSIAGSPITTSGTLAFSLSGTALPTTSGGTGLTSFTSGGVVYASSSSVLATGSALTFNGTQLTAKGLLLISDSQSYFGDNGIFGGSAADGNTVISYFGGNYLAFKEGTAERMRLNATGLGIGTSSPAYKLDVGATSDVVIAMNNSTSVTSGNRGTLSMYNSAGSTVGFIRFGAVTDNSGTDIQFGVRPAGGSLNSSAMKLDSSGNLGLGVTPSAWNSSYGVIQGYSGWSIFGDGTNSNSVDFMSNAYKSGASTYTYLANSYATRYQQKAGVHAWYNAPSSTGTISFTQAMTLTADGDLLVGDTTNVAGARLRIVGDGVLNAVFRTTRASGSYVEYDLGASGATIGYAGSAGQLTSGTTADFTVRAESNLTFAAGGGTERARITSGGTFKIGDPTNTVGTSNLLIVGTGNAQPDTVAVFNTFNANVNALTISNWFGSATTQGPRISFDNSGRGTFVIGASNGSNNFDICRSWGTPDLRIDGSGNLLVGATSLPTTYGATTGVVYQTGGVWSDRGQFSATGGSTTTFVTLANVSNNQSYIVSIRQSGSGGNSVFGYAMAYGASLNVIRAAQSNTNPVLDMNFTQSGLSMQLILGSGFGNTTWDWVITRLG